LDKIIADAANAGAVASALASVASVEVADLSNAAWLAFTRDQIKGLELMHAEGLFDKAKLEEYKNKAVDIYLTSYKP
jgi:hypothetical protein